MVTIQGLEEAITTTPRNAANTTNAANTANATNTTNAANTANATNATNATNAANTRHTTESGNQGKFFFTGVYPQKIERFIHNINNYM